MTELVPVDNDLAKTDADADRRLALEELNQAAETAESAGEAHAIMIKGRVLADLLAQAQVPFEEARLAGKASLTAARRLGFIFLNTSPKPRTIPGQRRATRSERGELWRALGLGPRAYNDLLRLARIPDPDFQRYVQTTDRIPSVNGALRVCCNLLRSGTAGDWRVRRRRRANIPAVPNPSLEEAHSRIRVALGHLNSGRFGGTPKRIRDIGEAIDHLYAAEDLIRPYLGGYVK